MLYASALIGQPLRDAQGRAAGYVRDIVLMLPGPEERAAGPARPRLYGLVAGAHWRGPAFLVPVTHLDRLGPGPVVLTGDLPERAPYTWGERELLVRKHMWDCRVIDTATHRVRRIGDAVLGVPDESPMPDSSRPPDYPAGQLVLQGADIGAAGLVRRLGLYPLLSSIAGRWLGAHILPWEQMELVAVGLLGEEVRHADLNALHPVELAQLSQSMSLRETAELLAALDPPLAADVMEELAADRQVAVVEFMPDLPAEAILAEMAPDDATDLLGDLPDERAAPLLAALAPEAGNAVRRLLRYPDNTAGGLMTTRFVTIPQDLAVREVIERLRAAPEMERANMVYYIYVTADEHDERVVGVVTLRDLLLAEPEARVADFMERDLLYAAPGDTAAEVARRMAQYNLLGMPVLDGRGRILGIITVDDALEVLLPADWQRRLPRVFS